MIAQPGQPNADQQADMFVLGVIPTVGQNAKSVFRSDSEEPPSHEFSRGGHRLVTRAPSDIYLHPTLIKHGLSQSLMPSSKTNQSWDPSKPELIFITRSNVLLKGYETLQVALQNGLDQLFCLEYDYTNDEALLWILKQSQLSHQLNDFHRILLALEFEPSLIERARENQRLGGKLKGSTNLTEDRIIDCRREIATMAYVCEANVEKVRRLVQAQDHEVLALLHAGEVSIHRAWRWLDRPEERTEYFEKQVERGIRRDVSALLKRHHKKQRDRPDLRRIGLKLGRMSLEQINPIQMIVVRHREPIICVSKGLLGVLESQEVLPL